ncbi:hypothetical protein A2954_02145 [Candidatus Roizmanbacteria bacterium RIFCSPLOWO2_01_FULL_37_12]|uniref:Uncharacterized protein n=2 Tax=Microgenomates group TaxID=1794810 RepID=A0A1F7IB31_9BACT|nr:MAG: hypothetical protein A2777_03765 [Candidatus Gottesmanbacteria bacterium RIFCSPHIGHO2_01_FULL_40_15]OGK40552.1 MAG: hypothetical protein A2954_02145 [Candidatus Roizmanbacteria bacterium RIFCSPLOWO2_01_FULL_37_12]
MIVDILLIVVVSFLSLIGGLLNLLAFVIPEEIQLSLIDILSNLKFFMGILPVVELLNVLATILTFLGLWYLVKSLLKIWAGVPMVGKKIAVK